MKIVVDISEKDYLAFCLQFDNGVLDETVPSHRAKIAIANGTPLPKDNDVLDKIRAEIVELQKDYQEYGWAYDDVIEIIDKYKAESEDKE